MAEATSIGMHDTKDTEIELKEKELMDNCEDIPFPTLEDCMGKDRFAEYRQLIAQFEDERTETGDSKSPKKFRNRPLADTKIVYQENAWDDVEWDEEQKAEALQKVENNSKDLVDEAQRLSLEENAAQNWSKFYGIHQNKFFRDRTWLFTEFPDFIGHFGSSVEPEISKSETEKKRKNETFPGENSRFRILEVGCGNGSTVIPLLLYNNHPETYVYCCDFSPQAVQIVTQNPALEIERCTPFVWDITEDNPNLPFPLESLDIVSMIFVLSAISPDKFDQVFQNLYKILKPDGLILFRDYGLHDLVQLRIKPGRCISNNFYFRGDGTRVYFFTEGSSSLFRYLG